MPAKIFVIVFTVLIAQLSVINVVFATNWVYLDRLEGTRYGSCTEYLDTDSVLRKDDRLSYWTLWVMDDYPRSYQTFKKMLRKNEALLTDPPQTRVSEYYQYDENNQETFRYIFADTHYYKSREALADEPAIQHALQHVGSRDILISVKPADISIAPQNWQKLKSFDEFDLMWDNRLINKRPRITPEVVEMIVRWVWNENGAAARKAYLEDKDAKRGSQARIDTLVYSQVTYQFLVNQNKMKILTIGDYATDGRRVGYTEIYKWQDIEPGSEHDAARQTALKWIKQ